MTNASGGNRRQRKAHILVNAGRGQPLGIGRQLGISNSGVSDNAHAQSMAEPQTKGAEDVVFGCYR